jgi:hypothetical protein
MMRMLGFLMMAGLIWIGVEIYQKGPDEAFDGTFSFLSWGDDLPEQAVEHISTPRRVGVKVQAAIDQGESRYQAFADD